MGVRHQRKKNGHNNIFYTIIAVILICTVFLSLVGYFNNEEEAEA